MGSFLGVFLTLSQKKKKKKRCEDALLNLFLRHIYYLKKTRTQKSKSAQKNEMKSAKTNEMKSNSWEQFPQESPPLRSKDVGRVIACIFYGSSTGKRRRKTSSSLVQRTSDALSHISNLCPLRIFGLHGFYVDPTQAKG